MSDARTIQKQLRKLKFGGNIWNQAELRELPHIIHEDETISECVNGFYEGGVALLVATEMRVLLIDKKPLNYLTVEDLRFDMINEIDYCHRLMGAYITISTGSKTLKFSSFNKTRLRRLINLVQEHMSQHKKQQAEKAQTQQQHLEEINQQLQMYLLAQHQYLQQAAADRPIEPVKPAPQLSDYLFAQRLLKKFYEDNNDKPPLPAQAASDVPIETIAELPSPPPSPPETAVTQADLVADARREVFSGIKSQPTPPSAAAQPANNDHAAFKSLEINPLRIAYSKLPMMLRNRRFGHPERPSYDRSKVAPAAVR